MSTSMNRRGFLKRVLVPAPLIFIPRIRASRSFVNANGDGMQYTPAFVNLPFSIFGWVKPTSIVNNMSFGGFTTGAAAMAYTLVQNKAGGNRLLVVGAQGNYLVYNNGAGGIVQTGEWQSFGGRWEASGLCDSFLNNNRSNFSEGTPGGIASFTKGSIGCLHVAGYQNIYDGLMGRFAYFGGALTNDDFAALHAAGPPMSAFPSAPIDCWNLLGDSLVGMRGTVLTNNGTTSSSDNPRLYF